MVSYVANKYGFNPRITYVFDAETGPELLFNATDAKPNSGPPPLTRGPEVRFVIYDYWKSVVGTRGVARRWPNLWSGVKRKTVMQEKSEISCYNLGNLDDAFYSQNEYFYQPQSSMVTQSWQLKIKKI